MAGLIAALVRHGDYHQIAGAPSAHQPFALTDEGGRQADDGARELVEICTANDWSISKSIDSSQMLRAWQTAEILTRYVEGAAIESFDALAERGLGCAANLTVAEIEEIIETDPRFPSPPANWKAQSDYRLPLQGAESLLEAGRRVADHILSRIEGADGSGRAVKVFVGHGAAFRHAAFHLGVLAFERIAELSMFHGRPVLLEREPSGVWRHVAGEWKVRPRGAEAKD